jgi:UDP-N-acetylglucosamine--N-acetylmuramyl-(pentapeptide) pyrophosphoryl-undecaprenol N-acetylglucosamine transferase
MSRPRILIAGGGSGGHVFPAIAVAEALQALVDVEVVFCGTARGVEAREIPSRGWPLELLEVEPIKGRGPARKVRAVIAAAHATVYALALVGRLRPRVVLSVGGYASGPATLAAALRGVPIAVLEPNRIVGLANRLVAPFARRAYVAWDEAAACFRKSARRRYGVPLRVGFSPSPYVAKGGSHVLIMGGSQGAAALNERIPEAIGRLRPSVRGLAVVHQTGRGREEAVREAYARQGITDVVVVAFLEDVAGAIAHADVVVARAGAGTIAEITAIGRAAVLVPFPHSADDHQTRNAEALAGIGAAICVPQDAADALRLANEIERLLQSDSARALLADAARAHGKPGAARDVAIDLLALAGMDEGPRKSNGGPSRGFLPLDLAPSGERRNDKEVR